MKKVISCFLLVFMMLSIMPVSVFAVSSSYYDIDGIRHGNAIFWIRIDNNEWEFKAEDNRKPKSANYEATVWVDGVKVYKASGLSDGEIVTGRVNDEDYNFGTHTIKVELIMLNHSKVYTEQSDWGCKDNSGMPPAQKSMLGVLDYPCNGVLSGWALIPNRETATAEVVFYVDGPIGKGSRVKTIQADIADPCLYYTGIVDSYNNIKHAFEIKLSDLGITSGSRWIYAYAKDPKGNAVTKEIGCYKVNIYDMMGSLDSYNNNNNLTGWALIPDNLWANAKVEFYLDAPKGQGKLIYSTYADKNRYSLYTSGIVNNCNNTWHGFEVDIRDLNLSSGTKTIYAYAVDPFSGGNNTILIGSTQINIGVIDKEPPILTYELNTTQWTNEEITIKLTVTDASGVKWIYSFDDCSWRSGNNKKTVEEAYKAWINGNYIFEVTDIKNNSKQYTVPISNIDMLPPFGFFYNLRNQDGKTYVDLVVIDLPGIGLSGIKTIKYGYSNGRGVGNHPKEWTAVSIDEPGKLTETISIPIEGKREKFVFIYLEDYAGNVFDPKLGYGPFRGYPSSIELVDINIEKYFDSNLGKYCYRLEPVFSEDNVTAAEYKWEIIEGSENIVLYNSSNDDPVITVTDQNGGGTARIKLSVRIGDKWLEEETSVTLGTPVIINLSEKYIKVQEVDVSIDYFATALTKQYKIGESGQWINYTVPFKVTENTTIYAKAVDAAGNEFNASCQIINIDRTAPIGTIVYSKTQLTNQDVVATVIFDESESYIEITNGDGSYLHTFTENGEYTFVFRDQAGNVGTATAVVNNIDKIAPTANIEYSTIHKTNGDVISALIPSEEIIITNNDGEDTYSFTSNGEFIFEFVDLAGNTGSAKAIVNNIDKDPPTALFNYSITEPTKAAVVATLIPSENVTITNNNGLPVYTFTQNGNFTFYMIDEAGNRGFATAVVKNIDSEVSAYIVYSSTEPTYGEVTATIQSDENIIVLNNNQLHYYTFTENGEFTFEYEDELGNKGTITAVVNNILLSLENDISLIQLKSPYNNDNRTSVIQGGSLAFIVRVIADKNGKLMLQLDCMDMNLLDSIDYSQEFFNSIVLREAIKDQFGNTYTLEAADTGSKSFVLKSAASLNKGTEYQIKIVISIGETMPKDSYQLKIRGTNQTLQIDVVEIPPLL